jgi:squalene-associated FAD-dependent desaturase
MLPAPLHLTPSFARYPHLKLRDKVQIGRALLAARRDRGPQGDMASWLTRHHQSRATRRAFWDPFLVPALNAPLEEAAAADALFVIRTAFLSSRAAARIGYTTVPLARLAEAAAARADAVHLRTAVVSLDYQGAHASGLHTESERRSDFDAFVLAVPPQRLAGMLGPEQELGVSGLDSFRTQPIVDVHLWYALPARTRLLNEAGFAALLDSPVQWVFEKGPGYLCCSLSAAQDLISLPERELVDRCHRELAAVLPLLRDIAPIRGAATRDPDATFVPTPGLRRPGPATAVGNVAVAGAWTDTGWPATMESAVRSGRAATAHLLRTQPSWAERNANAPASAVEELARAV